MKKTLLLLPLLVVLLATACKKDEVFVEPEIPVVKEHGFLTDSISFTLEGKRYTNELAEPQSLFPRGASNRGTNMRLSTVEGDWYLSSGGKYWVGAPDSVQYGSFSTTRLNQDAGEIEVEFVKNLRRSNLLYIGAFYYPRFENNYYTAGDYKYALDFGREGKDEGVAIRLSLSTLGKLTSYSPNYLFQESKLTAESQLNSTFKVLKVEEIKGTDYVIIEARFEVNLFDEKENPVKITEGYFRISALKCGNRSSHILWF